MKRTVSILLSLLLIATVFASFGTVNAAASKKINVRLYIDTKMADSKKVYDSSVTIPAQSALPFTCEFATTKAMRGGAMARLELSENGKLLNKQINSFAISDFAPESVRFAFLNVGSCKQPGSEDMWSDFLKRNIHSFIFNNSWISVNMRFLFLAKLDIHSF